MPASYFLKGMFIGFAIAAPVGPIGVLCIRRSLANGRLVGFATGLGAATADAAYGCVAAFGLTTVSNFLVGQRFWLGLLSRPRHTAQTAPHTHAFPLRSPTQSTRGKHTT